MTQASQVFDPQRLTPDASLQRVVIGALPGVPADIAARPAADVCSRDALVRLVLDTVGLPAPEPERLGDQLTELRSSPDPETRKLAGRVLRAYGSRLGALLATLKHPGTPTQQGGTAARRAYLEHWLGIERVWLGGGLLTLAGAGDILAGAQQLLSRAGTVLELRVGHCPRVLPLLGAARLSEPHDGRALVADAGHSTIKSAVAVIDGGALAALETLGALPAPRHGGGRAADACLVAALVAAAGALGAGPGRHRRVVVSVASYLDGGAPLNDGRSIYGGIAPVRISQLLAASTGDDMSVEFVHDGSASALGIADPQLSAVVTIGTWLGIGFTPSNRPLLSGDPIVRERVSQPNDER
ncbi:MAG: hypothetical protein ABR540_15375 [Acidimicrobiales bacterium]